MPQRSSTEWRTVISTSTESATPPNIEATKWLTRKFSPAGHDDFERDGLRFDTDVFGKHDSPSEIQSVGLIVFEVPLRAELLDDMDA